MRPLFSEGPTVVLSWLRLGRVGGSLAFSPAAASLTAACGEAAGPWGPEVDPRDTCSNVTMLLLVGLQLSSVPTGQCPLLTWALWEVQGV